MAIDSKPVQIVKLVKLKEAESPRHANNIEEGFEVEGMFLDKPEVGECFYIGLDDEEHLFKTSPVQEILSDNTFRTLNSIYQWTVN